MEKLKKLSEIERKRVAIRAHCDKTPCTSACPLYGLKGGCWRSATDEEIERNYKILFPEEPEKVDHPAHYQGKHECIDEMVAMFGVEAVKHFCMCNVYKYRYRAAAKNGQEDLDKANWYMDKLIELGGI